MSKKKFTPSEWLNPKPEPKKEPLDPASPPTSDIETITQRIEAAGIDLTSDYAAWRDLGFALADELGEGGRHYFHRLSSFYSGYEPKETDQQFDACLKSNNSGITIKTLFHKAKEAGIDLRTQESKPPKQTVKTTLSEEPKTELPNLPEEIFGQLPDFLQRITKIATSPEERDMLLLGSITTISCCLPHLYGIYDSRKVYPNLYLFITAQASAGKGKLVHCKQL